MAISIGPLAGPYMYSGASKIFKEKRQQENKRIGDEIQTIF